MTRARSRSALYVIDSHALYWYWAFPSRLGFEAQAAFQQIEGQQALGLVPLIAALEVHYVSLKLGMPRSIDAVLNDIDRAPGLRLEPLGRQHLIACGRLTDIPEMHDRLIAAVALVRDAILVTRDDTLRGAHSIIRTQW